MWLQGRAGAPNDCQAWIRLARTEAQGKACCVKCHWGWTMDDAWWRFQIQCILKSKMNRNISRNQRKTAEYSRMTIVQICSDHFDFPKAAPGWEVTQYLLSSRPVQHLAEAIIVATWAASRCFQAASECFRDCGFVAKGQRKKATWNSDLTGPSTGNRQKLLGPGPIIIGLVGARK